MLPKHYQHAPDFFLPFLNLVKSEDLITTLRLFHQAN
jgi:hypothetical protein